MPKRTRAKLMSDDDDPYSVKADEALWLAEMEADELAAIAERKATRDKLERRASDLSNDLARLARDLDNETLRDLVNRFDELMTDAHVYQPPQSETLDDEVPF